MSVEQELRDRAGNACELCGSANSPALLEVGPDADGTSDMAVFACSVCAEQITGPAALTPNHWRCLNETAWSQVPAIQVASFRLLSRMPQESWARNLLDMLYLENETLVWAKSGLDGDTSEDEATIVHKDTNGAVLNTGDTVTLIKDLKVKGAGFTAKRGTAVRNIGLVADNAAQIEGRVNDQRIVILTEFVKKA